MVTGQAIPFVQVGVIPDLRCILGNGHTTLPIPVPADGRAEANMIDDQISDFIGDEIVKSGGIVRYIGFKKSMGQLPLRPENGPENAVHHGMGQKIRFKKNRRLHRR